MKQRLYTSILAAFIALTSCNTKRLTTTDTNANETIVFGRLDIVSEKPLTNRKILLHFNERLWAKNAVRLDENGYFYMKIPLGKNFIATIEYLESRGYYKNIPNNYLSVEAPSPDNVYYIGDIQITWTPVKSDLRTMTLSIAGTIAESLEKGEQLSVTVKQSDATIDYFKQKFPDNKKEIKTNPVTINK
jgi:hypothetical protein